MDVALQTGLRVGELANINIEDIDLRRKALKVTRLKKARKRPETLPISKELARHLKEYLKAARRRKGPLFLGKRGPLSRQGLQRIWKVAVKRACLPSELSIHSARHTAATTMLKKTKNLRLVQKMLGHSNPTVTANMYADVSFEDMQDGINGLYD